MIYDQSISFPRLEEEGYYCFSSVCSPFRHIFLRKYWGQPFDFCCWTSDSGPIPRILISHPSVNRLAISFEHYLSILEMNISFGINGVYISEHELTVPCTSHVDNCKFSSMKYLYVIYWLKLLLFLASPEVDNEDAWPGDNRNTYRML